MQQLAAPSVGPQPAPASASAVVRGSTASAVTERLGELLTPLTVTERLGELLTPLTVAERLRELLVCPRPRLSLILELLLHLVRGEGEG